MVLTVWQWPIQDLFAALFLSRTLALTPLFHCYLSLPICWYISFWEVIFLCCSDCLSYSRNKRMLYSSPFNIRENRLVALYLVKTFCFIVLWIANGSNVQATRGDEKLGFQFVALCSVYHRFACVHLVTLVHVG